MLLYNIEYFHSDIHSNAVKGKIVTNNEPLLISRNGMHLCTS